MTVLTENERVTAKILYDKGLSPGEIAHRLLYKRTTQMHTEIAEEVRIVVGGRDFNKDPLGKNLRTRPQDIYPKMKVQERKQW